MIIKNLNIKLTIGLCYLVILFIGLFLVFSNVDINDLLSYNFILQNKNFFLDYKQNNLIFFTIVFFIFSILWVFFLGFGLPLGLLAGFLFGKWWGTIILLFSSTIGATILYFTASIFFKNLVEKIFSKKFLKLKKIFNQNEFIYFMCYRIIGGGGLPFFIQNLLPVIFNMSIKNYFFSTFLGLIPSMLILASFGSGIETIIDSNTKPNIIDIITLPEIYLPIIGFFLLLIISFFIKKFFIKDL